MNNKFKEELENKAQEISFRSYLDNPKIDSNIDTTFAKCIEEFMNGKSTMMPSKEKIDELKTQKKYNVISMGYGYTINDNLEITHVEPVTKTSERVDIISENQYYAFHSSISEKSEKMMKKIDIEKEPYFDKEKVKMLQQYIQIMNQEKNKMR